MKTIEKKSKKTTRDFGGLCKLAFMALAVFALAMLPYKIDLNKGSLKATVLLADDDGGSSDHDSDGGHDIDSDHDSDGDHDSINDHDGDEQEDDHDADNTDEDSNDHDSDDQYSSHDSSIDRDSSADHGDELLEVGGMQGLKEVSSTDEASLVGNWGKASTTK